jgi:hypothetical protein
MNTIDNMKSNEAIALGVVVPSDTHPVVYASGLFIERESMLTGTTRMRFIAGATVSGLIAWSNGAVIQDVLPDCTKDDREFIITGSTPNEWADAFSDDDYTALDMYFADDAENEAWCF